MIRIIQPLRRTAIVLTTAILAACASAGSQTVVSDLDGQVHWTLQEERGVIAIETSLRLDEAGAETVRLDFPNVPLAVLDPAVLPDSEPRVTLEIEIDQSRHADGTIGYDVRLFAVDAAGERQLRHEPSILAELGEPAVIHLATEGGEISTELHLRFSPRRVWLP